MLEKKESTLIALGKRISMLRKRQHLSMEKLAYGSEISKETLRKIEIGGTDPRYTTLEKIAWRLGLTVSYLTDLK